jgi:hypothetical protein
VVVEELKHGGAQFLKHLKDDSNKASSWIKVDDTYASKKVSHALRCKDWKAQTLYSSQSLQSEIRMTSQLTKGESIICFL